LTVYCCINLISKTQTYTNLIKTFFWFRRCAPLRFLNSKFKILCWLWPNTGIYTIYGGYMTVYLWKFISDNLSVTVYLRQLNSDKLSPDNLSRTFYPQSIVLSQFISDKWSTTIYLWQFIPGKFIPRQFIPSHFISDNLSQVNLSQKSLSLTN
jgi:hypothetical protein